VPASLAGTNTDTGLVEAGTPSTRVGLVTGAAGGIAPAVCAELSARGIRVVAVDIDGPGVERVAGAVEGARAVRLDVTDVDAVDALVSSLDRLDVVVNLAGLIRRAAILDVTNADFLAVMATHAEATLNTMRAAVPLMRAHGYGRIVNTSSIATRGTVSGISYGAAKAAIEGISRNAALELAADGITVNCVAPGLIDAGMFLSTPEETRLAFGARVPMRRLGTPADIAAAVGFLASEDAGYVTGQTLTVCGGLTLGF
jgi:3-oxoacyl-[acyl-carrier protein] reductase